MMGTNVKMLKNLEEVFNPKRAGILSNEEVKLVTNTLHLKEMDELSLRNLRDTTVMFYSLREFEKDEEEKIKIMDKISAITAVIDEHIFLLGGEV